MRMTSEPEPIVIRHEILSTIILILFFTIQSLVVELLPAEENNDE